MFYSLIPDGESSETSHPFPTLPFPPTPSGPWVITRKSSLFVSLGSSTATQRSALTFHTGFIKAMCLNLCGSSTSVDNVSIFPEHFTFSEEAVWRTRRESLVEPERSAIDVFGLII